MARYHSAICAPAAGQENRQPGPGGETAYMQLLQGGAWIPPAVSEAPLLGLPNEIQDVELNFR